MSLDRRYRKILIDILALFWRQTKSEAFFQKYPELESLLDEDDNQGSPQLLLSHNIIYCFKKKGWNDWIQCDGDGEASYIYFECGNHSRLPSFLGYTVGIPMHKTHP